MGKPEINDYPLSLNFEGKKLSLTQQGQYSFSEKTAYLLSESDFKKSISAHKDDAVFHLHMAEDFPGQDEVLLSSLRRSEEYWQMLQKDSNAFKARWDSACAHEIAHHLMDSSIADMRTINYWLHNPKEVPTERWGEISQKVCLLRGLQELNSTLFEMQQYRDPGAVFILLPSFYEDIIFDAFQEKDQVERIKYAIEGMPIAGEYNLAALSLFSRELVGIDSALDPENIYSKVREQIGFFLANADEFISDRIQWYGEITETLLNKARELVRQMVGK